MTWDRVKGRLKIAWPAVGLLVGLSAGACFLYLHAWETAGFALVSGAYALLLMSFTIKSYLNLKAVERCDELTTDEEVASLYDEQDENNSNEPYYASSGTIQHKASMRDRHHSRRGHLVAERPESWTWWTYRWACFVAAAAGASVGTSGIIAYALLAHGNHESLSPTSHWLTIGTPRPSLHSLALTCLVPPPAGGARPLDSSQQPAARPLHLPNCTLDCRAVWAFMVLKWASGLFLEVRSAPLPPLSALPSLLLADLCDPVGPNGSLSLSSSSSTSTRVVCAGATSHRPGRGAGGGTSK
jgi:hypothetical protein